MYNEPLEKQAYNMQLKPLVFTRSDVPLLASFANGFAILSQSSALRVTPLNWVLGV